MFGRHCPCTYNFLRTVRGQSADIPRLCTRTRVRGHCTWVWTRHYMYTVYTIPWAVKTGSPAHIITGTMQPDLSSLRQVALSYHLHRIIKTSRTKKCRNETRCQLNSAIRLTIAQLLSFYVSKKVGTKFAECFVKGHQSVNTHPYLIQAFLIRTCLKHSHWQD